MPDPIADRHYHEAVELLAEIARRIVAASDPDMSDRPRPESPPAWLQRARSDGAGRAARATRPPAWPACSIQRAHIACPAPKQHPERGAERDRPGTRGRIVLGGVRSPLVSCGLSPARQQGAQHTNLRFSVLVHDRSACSGESEDTPIASLALNPNFCWLTRLVVRSTMHPAILCSYTFQRGCLNSIPVGVDGESQALHTPHFKQL